VESLFPCNAYFSFFFLFSSLISYIGFIQKKNLQMILEVLHVFTSLSFKINNDLYAKASI